MSNSIPYKFNPLGIDFESVDLSKGLDFHAPFDNDLNDIINNLVGSKTGNVFGIYLDSTSNIGKYLSGTLDWKSATYSLSYNDSANMFQYGTSDFSISYWLKAPKFTSYNNNCIVSKKTDNNSTGFVNLRSTSAGQMNMRVAYQNDLYTTTSAKDSRWVNWVFIRKNGIGYWYRNGVLDASGTCDGSVNSTDVLRIGYNAQWSTTGYFWIKSLRIYNRALNDKQILALKDEFGEIRYKINASAQTLSFRPVVDGQTATISYSTIASANSISFQILSGTLPNGISFNTSTGVFSGKSFETQDTTYPLSVKILSSEQDVDYTVVTITLDMKATTNLTIVSPQTFNFITEQFSASQINCNTDGLTPTLSYDTLPAGISISYSTSTKKIYINSSGTQTTAYSASIQLQLTTQYHPTPVTATININVALNQITTSNTTLDFYTQDGQKAIQIQYESQKTITPVFSLTGTLPTGVTFDSSTGTFTYDGITTTESTANVSVTISSSTGCSAPATANITINVVQGSNPLAGLLFYAPLQDNFNATGGTLNNQNNWSISSNFNGKKCAIGSSATRGIYYNLTNPITGNDPFTFSFQYYRVNYSDSQSLFYIGKSVNLQAFGYQGSNNLDLGTAWGDSFVYDSTPNVLSGEWAIFTVTYNQAIIKVYRNGVLISTLTSPNPLTLNIQKSTGGFSGNYGDLAIGSRWNDYRSWKGGIRNFYIFNYAMSDAQVATFYNNTKDL